MRKIILIYLLLLFWASNCNAQLIIHQNSNPITLANAIVGSCVEISTPSVGTTNVGAIGTYNFLGTSPIGVNNGVILSTGNVNSAVGPNNSTGTQTIYSFTPISNSILNNIATSAVYDQATFQFDVVPFGNILNMNYVFASEEFLEFACLGVNDVMGIYITGPNPGGGNYNNLNIALLPNGDIISVNNIHPITNTCTAVNPEFYVNNVNNAIEFDGYTTALTASIGVLPCSTYTIVVAIGDVNDPELDAAIFLDNIHSTCQDPPIFTQLGPYCVGATPGTLPTTSNNGIAGTWDPATINTSVAGTTTYTFTPTLACLPPVTMDIVVNSKTTPTFTQLGPYCVGATPGILPTTLLLLVYVLIQEL